MITAYVIIGGVSIAAVSGVLLEKQLVKKDAIGSAEMLDKTMEYTMKYGKFAIVTYVLWRIVTMF